MSEVLHKALKDIKQEKLDIQVPLLKAELLRILELMENPETFNRWGREKAELKAKMKEARRDMVRLDKLVYGYDVRNI